MKFWLCNYGRSWDINILYLKQTLIHNIVVLLHALFLGPISYVHLILLLKMPEGSGWACQREALTIAESTSKLSTMTRNTKENIYNLEISTNFEVNIAELQQIQYNSHIVMRFLNVLDIG